MEDLYEEPCMQLAELRTLLQRFPDEGCTPPLSPVVQDMELMEDDSESEDCEDSDEEHEVGTKNYGYPEGGNGDKCINPESEYESDQESEEDPEGYNEMDPEEMEFYDRRYEAGTDDESDQTGDESE